MMSWKSFGFCSKSIVFHQNKNYTHCFLLLLFSPKGRPINWSHVEKAIWVENLNQTWVKCQIYLVFGMDGVVNGWQRVLGKVAWMACTPFCKLMDMDAVFIYFLFLFFKVMISDDFFMGILILIIKVWCLKNIMLYIYIYINLIWAYWNEMAMR